MLSRSFRISLRHVLLGFVALTLSLSVPLPRVASAASPVTGFDVSYPQCGKPLPLGSFAFIGVTGGRAFSTNSCFTTEYDQSVSAGLGSAINLYMNLNAAIGSSASQGATGPKGTCGGGDKACQAYNYGWNAAKAAFALSGPSRPGQRWFLDIETANSWNAKSALNRETIQGTVDYLSCQGMPVGSCSSPMPVGIYSTPSMWNKITGSWQNQLPVWFAGTAASDCPGVPGFTGGPVVVVQNASGASNGDRAC